MHQVELERRPGEERNQRYPIHGAPALGYADSLRIELDEVLPVQRKDRAGCPDIHVCPVPFSK